MAKRARRAPRAGETGDFEPVIRRSQRRGGTGILVLVFIALVAVVAAAGVAWFYLRGGVEAVEEMDVAIVRADVAPIKERPKDPEGMEIPDQDKLVYERMQGGETRAGEEVERLLPPPERPVLPVPEGAPPPPRVEPGKPLALQPAGPRAPLPGEPGYVPELVDEPVPRPAPAPAGSMEPAKPQPMPKGQQPAPGAQPKPPVVVDSLPEETAMARAATARKPEPATKPKPEPKPAASTAAIHSGDWLIQLAAVRTREQAEREWRRLRAAHEPALGDLTPRIVEVDLGVKGVFFRLRAGPFATRQDAAERCQVLKARKVACLVGEAR